MNSIIRNLLALAVLLVLAAQAQALEDTSFTVTLPLGYVDQVFFNATSATQYNVSAGGQTNLTGFLQINITGNATQNFSISVNATATNVTLKAGRNPDPANETTITIGTGTTQIISNLSPGVPTYVWLWADFISAPINQVRLLNVSSSTYI